jgi:hypothetical protein
MHPTYSRAILAAAASVIMGCSAGKSAEDETKQANSQDAVTGGVRRSTTEEGVLVSGTQFRITASSQGTALAMQGQSNSGQAGSGEGEVPDSGDQQDAPTEAELQQLTSVCGAVPTKVFKLSGRQNSTESSSEFTGNGGSLTGILLTGMGNTFTVKIVPVTDASVTSDEDSHGAASRLMAGKICVVTRGNENQANLQFAAADIGKLILDVSGNSSSTVVLQDAVITDFSSQVSGTGNIDVTGAGPYMCQQITAVGNGKVTCS